MSENSTSASTKDASTVEKVESLEDSAKDLEKLSLEQNQVATADDNVENASGNNAENVMKDEIVETKEEGQQIKEENVVVEEQIQNGKQTTEEDQIAETKVELINQESGEISQESGAKIETQEETDTKIGTQDETDAKIETILNESEETKPLPVVEEKTAPEEPQPELTSNIEAAPLEEIQDAPLIETPEKPAPQPITHDGQEMDATILNLLENRLKEMGITTYNMRMSPGSKPGDNMLGIIAKVQVDGTDSSGSNIELNWIVKMAPPIGALRQLIKLEILYRNEVLVYESIFPIYKELEKERLIMNGFNSYPEYLFSNLENLKETVVMTDMSSLGYILRDKKEPLDLEHVKLVMKTYGKLHALSYAFQDKRPSLFEQFSSGFKRNIQDAIDVFELKKTQQGIMENALATLDPIRHNLAHKKFSKFVENFMAIYFEAARNSNKYSVIGHGDSWINNMLFKYENSATPGLPTAVCLLDFQTVTYASPVCDISYFLFTCTDKDFRDQHYDNVVKLYYYSLCSHLTDLGCDPEKFLPFHILEVELRKNSVAGLYLSILALMAMIRDSDEVGNWQSGDAGENAQAIPDESRNQDIYNERVRDVILDFSQKGYLDFLFPKK